tara:strand:+ start:1087 stop:1353 length:267 start_codon:yes stop_codon:yes gene_type:complete
MSQEVYKYIETALEKKKTLFQAEVINLNQAEVINLNQVKKNATKEFKFQDLRFWKLNDKSNSDQLRAVTGICFMFISLVVMGLYSNLL